MKERHPSPKVLYVITKSVWGGAQRYVYDLALAAHAAGSEVVVAVGGTGILVERLQDAGIRTIPLALRQRRGFFADLLTFGSLATLVRLMRAERADVVHANSAKAGGLGCLAARIAGVPRIIFTAHGWEFNAPRGLVARFGMRLFSWFTILLSHRTIAVSDAVRDDMRHWPFTRAKVVVVHNGIKCPALLSREHARKALAPGHEHATWIGMISELHPTKRLSDALAAFTIVQANYPQTVLVVIGEGRERAMLEDEIAKRALADSVVLAGFVPEAATYMHAFDIFLHSSQSEAFAYAILEAGCASLPVIATRVGGLPEIIEDGVSGLLVPPRQPLSLAHALSALLERPDRRGALAHALHARVTGEFSTERMLERTLALYVP